MKLLFSADWLRQKIASSLDADYEAGRPIVGSRPVADTSDGKVAILPQRNAVQIRIALGTLVRQLRLRDELTLQELAKLADVPEDELRQVETNPSFTARPRFIQKVSQHFGVPFNNLSQMTGATQTVERRLYNGAVKYAAHSDDVSPLSKEQLTVLNEFVSMLSETAGRDGK